MLTLAIKGVVRQLLSAAVEGVELLSRGTKILVERVFFLSLGLRVVKWTCDFIKCMRAFVEGVCCFVEWVSRCRLIR